MTTRHECFEYLGQVRGLNRKIERLDEKILSLRYSLLPGAIRYDKDRVTTSPKDNVTEIFSRIDELEQDKKKLIAERQIITICLFQIINRVPAGKERAFLLRFYIHCESMDKVADELGVTLRHCFRIRNNAILKFMEVLDDNRIS